MKRVLCGLAVCCFTVVASVAHAEQLLSSESGLPQSTVNEHRPVTGVVRRITDGAVFLKTDQGAIREFSLKEARQEKINNLAVGDRLQLDLNEQNQIIEISRVGSEGLKGHGKAPTVEGQVDRYDPMKKVIALKLEDGTSKSYHLKEAAATKMNAVQTGISVRLEFDPVNGWVRDFTIRS